MEDQVGPGSLTISREYVRHHNGYSLSGRIMLTAILILFSVVVIMVCLHIYARCYFLRARRRHIRRARSRTHLVFHIQPDYPDGILITHSRGLDAALLNSLPTFTFGKDEVELLECAVCLSEFVEREEGRMLPKCKHCFHVECIDMWFHSHSTCPLCRSPVDAADVPPLEEGGGDIVVELSELTQNQLGENSGLRQDVGVSQVEGGSSASFGGRRKGGDLVGVSIEVPKRSQSFCFPGSNSDESGPSCSRSPGPGFKSPTSRIMSLKRVWSRERKSPLPSPSGAAGSSCFELDIELGRVDSSSQVLTPR